MMRPEGTSQTQQQQDHWLEGFGSCVSVQIDFEQRWNYSWPCMHAAAEGLKLSTAAV